MGEVDWKNVARRRSGFSRAETNPGRRGGRRARRPKTVIVLLRTANCLWEVIFTFAVALGVLMLAARNVPIPMWLCFLAASLGAFFVFWVREEVTVTDPSFARLVGEFPEDFTAVVREGAITGLDEAALVRDVTRIRGLRESIGRMDGRSREVAESIISRIVDAWFPVRSMARARAGVRENEELDKLLDYRADYPQDGEPQDRR